MVAGVGVRTGVSLLERLESRRFDSCYGFAIFFLPFPKRLKSPDGSQPTLGGFRIRIKL
jgi:hypothetical protein